MHLIESNLPIFVHFYISKTADLIITFTCKLVTIKMVQSIPQCNIMEFPKNNPPTITDQNFLESNRKIAWQDTIYSPYCQDRRIQNTPIYQIINWWWNYQHAIDCKIIVCIKHNLLNNKDRTTRTVFILQYLHTATNGAIYFISSSGVSTNKTSLFVI